VIQILRLMKEGGQSFSLKTIEDSLGDHLEPFLNRPNSLQAIF
jgi:hypothetical protein